MLMKNTVGQGRPLTELRGAERQAVLKDKSLFKMYLRMNPEPKLPSNDYPEGRLKMRFLAMGNTTPEKWIIGRYTYRCTSGYAVYCQDDVSTRG